MGAQKHEINTDNAMQVLVNLVWTNPVIDSDSWSPTRHRGLSFKLVIERLRVERSERRVACGMAEYNRRLLSSLHFNFELWCASPQHPSDKCLENRKVTLQSPVLCASIAFVGLDKFSDLASKFLVLSTRCFCIRSRKVALRVRLIEWSSR